MKKTIHKKIRNISASTRQSSAEELFIYLENNHSSRNIKREPKIDGYDRCYLIVVVEREVIIGLQVGAERQDIAFRAHFMCFVLHELEYVQEIFGHVVVLLEKQYHAWTVGAVVPK